jgi:hypothetical protein
MFEATSVLKIAHPQRVNAVVIRKTPCVDDDDLETGVLSVSIGMDAIGHSEALREPSVGIAPIFV